MEIDKHYDGKGGTKSRPRWLLSIRRHVATRDLRLCFSLSEKTCAKVNEDSVQSLNGGVLATRHSYSSPQKNIFFRISTTVVKLD